MKQRRARVIRYKAGTEISSAPCPKNNTKIKIAPLSWYCINDCDQNIMSDPYQQKVLCAHPDLFKKKRGKK